MSKDHKAQLSKETPLSLKQKLLLSIGVPCVFLLVLEGIARLILLSGFGGSEIKQPLALEMPTWMLRDANALARATPSKDAIDWLSMFVEGDGYRVHMIPGETRYVKNTFSLIAADRERRYEIISNSVGFRGPEISPRKEPNTFRITVFGDSSSFGWGVDTKDTWWAILQNELQERYPHLKIEVANFAIPGDSSAYGQLIVDTFAPRFESDLVILGFGANDAKAVFTSHTEQVNRFKQRRILLRLAGLFDRSALVNLIKRAISSASERKRSPDLSQNKRVPAVTLDDFANNMSSMALKAKQNGADSVLFLGLCTHPSYARRARAEAKRNAALWFNGQSRLLKALPAIRNKQIYPDYVERMEQSYPDDLARNRLFYVTSDGCHPNELGHRLVADELAALITSSNLIPQG